jgi:hypothetical protein
MAKSMRVDTNFIRDGRLQLKLRWLSMLLVARLTWLTHLQATAFLKQNPKALSMLHLRIPKTGHEVHRPRALIAKIY